MTENDLMQMAARLRSLPRSEIREVLGDLWLSGRKQDVGRILELLGLPPAWILGEVHSPARAELASLQRLYSDLPDIPTP